MIDDLITLIDFCNEIATRIRGDWSDPRTECRAIWDAHDMAHVLTGGDRTRDWGSLTAMLLVLGDESEAWPDVCRRTIELRDRLAVANPMTR